MTELLSQEEVPFLYHGVEYPLTVDVHGTIGTTDSGKRCIYDMQCYVKLNGTKPPIFECVDRILGETLLDAIADRILEDNPLTNTLKDIATTRIA